MIDNISNIKLQFGSPLSMDGFHLGLQLVTLALVTSQFAFQLVNLFSITLSSKVSIRIFKFGKISKSLLDFVLLATQFHLKFLGFNIKFIGMFSLITNLLKHRVAQ